MALPKSLINNSLFAGSAVYILANVINAAIPFALLPVLTRYLRPDEYGEVAMFQTLLGALGAFVGINVAGAAGRKYYDGNLAEDELKQFIGSCLQILLVSALTIFFFVFVFSKQLGESLGLPTAAILSAVAVSGGNVIVQLRLNQWQVRKQAHKYGGLQVSQSALNMLLSLLLVVVMMRGAEGRITAQVLAMVISALIALLFLNKDDLLTFLIWKPKYIREALAFGAPLVPHIGGAFLLNSVDRFVINAQLGLAEAGLYMVAVQLVGVMALVFSAVNSAYVPWLFERLNRDLHEEKCLIVRYTYIWFVAIIFGAGLVHLFGPALVVLIAGPEYSQAGRVIGWLALGQAFNGMYLMVTNYIFYSKRTSFISLATMTSGLLNIALLFILIQEYGLVGAAMAYAFSMATLFVITWWLAHRMHPMPWFGFIFR